MVFFTIVGIIAVFMILFYLATVKFPKAGSFIVKIGDCCKKFFKWFIELFKKKDKISDSDSDSE